jgi:UDP-glucose 4-epimerase
VALRYFNVFGPRQDPSSQYSAVIPRFILAFLGDETPVIYGDGEQSRDFTYIDNVVEANLRAAEADQVAGHVFNIATGSRISLNAMLDQLRSLTGKAIEAEYLEPRAGDVKHSLADISLASDGLGYAPKVDFAQGLRKTFDWYAESGG